LAAKLWLFHTNTIFAALMHFVSPYLKWKR